MASLASSVSCLQILRAALNYKARSRRSTAPQPVVFASQTSLSVVACAAHRLQVCRPRSSVDGEAVEQAALHLEADLQCGSTEPDAWPPAWASVPLSAQAIVAISDQLTAAAQLPELRAVLFEETNTDQYFNRLIQRYRQQPILASGFLCGLFDAATREQNVLERTRSRAIQLLRSGSPFWPPQAQTHNVRQLVFFALHPNSLRGVRVDDNASTPQRLDTLGEMVWAGQPGERYISLEDLIPALLDLMWHAPKFALEAFERFLLRSPGMQKQLK